MVRIIAVSTIFLLGSLLWAQDTPSADPNAVVPAERWNLYYQATSIGQTHATFRSPYQGRFSFLNQREYDASLTTTLFLGARLADNLRFYFDPEIAGGRGLSNVNGIANPPNGEMPRVLTATPKPYIARLYLAYDVGFGDAREHFESDLNQLGGDRPMTRYTVTVGRFSIEDFFDNNPYSHDPRTQFEAWGLMANGAWDYPADTRGYTWGMVHEFHTSSWSWRYGSIAEPSIANGERFDRRLFVDRGDVFEEERRFSFGTHAGAVRFLEYTNHTHSGAYADALKLADQTGARPDVTAVRRYGTRKYGFGINAGQEIAKNIGVFMRLGWNDGKTQDFAFTAIDRLASAGVSVNGARWNRKNDVLATSFTAAGISGVHALYLQRGGYDFLIGDGTLNYAPEYLWESYYSARLFPGLYASIDAEHYNNLAYNHDRGPVWVLGLRLHAEFGLKPLVGK